MFVYFQVYRDRIFEYRWRIRRLGNHEIIADCAEGYKTKADCLKGIALVKTCGNAQVVEA